MAPTAQLIDGELTLAGARVDGPSGLIATAAWDEDSITLAARAGLAVLARNAQSQPQALVVATVSAPLPEPGVAPYLAEIFDLQASDLYVSEQGGSVAAGAGAVTEALVLINAGFDPVLVIAADTRRDARGRALGDGAVALLLGSVGQAGSLTHAGAAAELFVDRWRRADGTAVESGDRSLDRFGPGRAFTDSLDPESFNAVVSSGADGQRLARAGFLGCPHPLAELLVSECEQENRILVAATAGGVSHGFWFEAGPEMDAITRRARGEIEAVSASDPTEQPDETSFHPFTSQASSRRERGATYRLEARRDPETNEVIYPPPPSAVAGSFEPMRLSRTGTVHTFARDHVFPMGGPLTMAVVSLDGGGRFYGQVVAGGTVAIGDTVELVLRRIHSGSGLPHYFWKVSPKGEGA
jgi:uncharacterized OB-fold protein